MPQIPLNIPEDLLLVLREHPAEVAREIRLFAALHYFRAKRLSLGQAARLAEMHRLAFMETLSAHGIPPFDLSPEDAAHEIEAAGRPSDDRQ
jgi:predicted HTH domain antitoxin